MFDSVKPRWKMPSTTKSLDKTDEAEEIGLLTRRRAANSRLSRTLWLSIFSNAVLALLTSVLAATLYAREENLRMNRNNAMLRRMDAFSPLHDQVTIPLIDTVVNGSLLDMDRSIYRQPPSPEVDAAWHRIGSLMPHVISTEDVIRLGKDPSRTARWPESWGFGPDAHLGELDVLHTIHCLNAIRRDVHWQYYFKDKYPTGDFPELHRVHTDHCIYIVLQNLMCSATGDMITSPWVEGQLHPFPDFSIRKRCRNFDAILNWHEETMITDMEGYKRITMPEGHVPYRMSEEFQRMFGTDEPN